MPGANRSLTPKFRLDCARLGAQAQLLGYGDVSDEAAARYWNAYHDWLAEAGIDADAWMERLIRYHSR